MAVDTESVLFPLQKVPYAKKNEEWREANMNYYIGQTFVVSQDEYTRTQKLQRNYNIYNGKLKREDFEYVTNPYGTDEDMTFPADLTNINILKTSLDLLIGEEIKRPFKIYAHQTNTEVLSEKLEDKDGETKEILTSMIVNRLLPMYAQDGKVDQKEQQELMQRKEEMLLKRLENHTGHDYKDELEEAAQNYINWMYKKYDMKNLFTNAWKDGLISCYEIGFIGEINGKPSPKRVNPVMFDYDKNPDIEFIDQSNWCVRLMWQSPNTIIDNFGSIMKKEDKDEIMEEQNVNALGLNSDINSTAIRASINKLPNDTDYYHSNLIPVYHVCWRSFQKVGYLTGVDQETGNPYYDIVSEGYKLNEWETIEWDWISQIWEGYRAGGNIYMGIRPTDYKDLPYVGIVHNNTNASPVSVVDTAFPVLTMWVIVWYRLELTMARDKGKVLTIDVTQIPKSLGYDFKEWAYWLSTMQVNLINPYEEGWDIKRSNPASFNQFSAVDLTMANVINEYVLLLSKLEELMGNIIGVPQQRLGSISQNELVGNVERVVIQSSHITEPMFYKHNLFKERFIRALLERAQQTWQGQEETLSMIMDDMTRVVWTMPRDFDLEDLDIHITDSSQEATKIAKMQSLAENAVASGSSLYEAGQMVISESVSEMMNKLKEIDAQRQQAEEQKAKAEREVMMLQQQVAKDALERDYAFKEEDSIRKSNTQVEVAIINQQGNLGPERDVNDNQVPDILEKDKLDEQKRSNKAEEEIKKEKNKIDKIKANKAGAK